MHVLKVIKKKNLALKKGNQIFFRFLIFLLVVELFVLFELFADLSKGASFTFFVRCGARKCSTGKWLVAKWVLIDEKGLLKIDILMDLFDDVIDVCLLNNPSVFSSAWEVDFIAFDFGFCKIGMFFAIEEELECVDLDLIGNIESELRFFP